jgi:hypothetical protein
MRGLHQTTLRLEKTELVLAVDQVRLVVPV